MWTDSNKAVRLCLGETGVWSCRGTMRRVYREIYYSWDYRSVRDDQQEVMWNITWEKLGFLLETDKKLKYILFYFKGSLSQITFLEYSLFLLRFLLLCLCVRRVRQHEVLLEHKHLIEVTMQLLVECVSVCEQQQPAWRCHVNMKRHVSSSWIKINIIITLRRCKGRWRQDASLPSQKYCSRNMSWPLWLGGGQRSTARTWIIKKIILKFKYEATLHLNRIKSKL